MNTIAIALFRVVSRVGRWLIKRLVKYGHTKVLAFIELRIETFRGRLGRARTKRRKRRLRMRIRWRVGLLKWLEENRRSHTKTVLRAVDQVVDEAGRRIPWDHLSERRAAA